MSKDNEKARNQGFAHRHAADRSRKFEAEGYPANFDPARVQPEDARRMFYRNLRKINEQTPQPIRQG